MAVLDDLDETPVPGAGWRGGGRWDELVVTAAVTAAVLAMGRWGILELQKLH